MPVFSIFTCNNDLSEIFEDLKNDGLICLQGGRVEVRKKLKELEAFIETEEPKNEFFHLTFDHPETELGFSYDENNYSMDEAKNLAIKTYEENRV